MFVRATYTDLAVSQARPGGAKTKSPRDQTLDPPRSGLPVGVGRADTYRHRPEALAPLETSSPLATPTNAPASQTWAASNGRGLRGQRAFDHTTGLIKATSSHSVATTMMASSHQTKHRTQFNPLSPSTRHSVGGFSPPSSPPADQLQRSTVSHARKAQRSGVDRTAYPPHSRLSLCHTHAERISIASVKEGAGTAPSSIAVQTKLASELSLTPRVQGRALNR